MPRPKKRCKVCFSPGATYYKPAGVPLREMEEVSVAHEELEALRLWVLSETPQEEAAKQMGVSQPTFHRLIHAGRKKIVEALVYGKAIKIDGGHFMLDESVRFSNGRIAMSSATPDLEGDVEIRFGRCSYFIIVTLEKGEIKKVEPIENCKGCMRGGAGASVAQILADHKIDCVITGNVGPRAKDALSQFGIPVVLKSGSKRAAIEEIVEK